jgi:ApaG protein
LLVHHLLEESPKIVLSQSARAQASKEFTMSAPKTTTPYQITVTSVSQYVQEQSSPEDHRFVFSYHITISNTGLCTAQLISRHWVITDAAGQVEEVQGEGVIGEQPTLRPGESFEYTSGCALNTPFGSMCGTYTMQTEDGLPFEAEIPEFFLVGPRTLH